MKANKDPKIQIKESDKDSFHVKLIRRVGDAKNPEIFEDIQIFYQKDFAGMLKAIDKQGINITGYDEMIVVHNPLLDEEEVAMKAQDEAVDKLRAAKEAVIKAEAEEKEATESKAIAEAKAKLAAESKAAAEEGTALAEKAKATADAETD